MFARFTLVWESISRIFVGGAGFIYVDGMDQTEGGVEKWLEEAWVSAYVCL